MDNIHWIYKINQICEKTQGRIIIKIIISHEK